MNTAPATPSPFERLPVELTRQIVSYAVPRGLTVSFAQLSPLHVWQRRLQWTIFTRVPPAAESSVSVTDDQSEIKEPSSLANRTSQSLICTCRLLSTEARAVFYGENEFLLRTTMPLHAGNFGPIQPHILRDIKVIRLLLEKNLYSIKLVSSHERFVKRFVETMSEHHDDEHRKPRLVQLRIDVKIIAKKYGSEYLISAAELQQLGHNHPNKDWNTAVSEMMFLLEPLTKLPLVETVEVTGLPKWFAECLELCISGKGGSVLSLRWPDHRLKNKNGTPRYMSLRPNDAPSLDWAEFAQRNSVELPCCLVAFFQQHNCRWPRLPAEVTGRSRRTLRNRKSRV